MHWDLKRKRDICMHEMLQYNPGRVAHSLKSKNLARMMHAILYLVNRYWILTNKCRNKLKHENEAKRCHGFRV
jgi:hypothetical protein